MLNKSLAGWRRWWMVLACAVLAGGLWGPSAAPAADLKSLDCSLKLIPADAAFYLSTMRLREQIEIVARSNAFKKVLELPALKMGLALYQLQGMQADSPVGKFQEALKNPEVQRVVDLIGEMFSDEVFVFGGENCTSMIALCQELNTAMSYGPGLMKLTPEGKRMAEDEIQMHLMMAVLADHLDALEVPDMVFGFKIEDKKLAIEQLAKLEMLVNVVAAQQPMLKDRIKRTKVGSYDYLTLELDGRMVPWQQIPMDKLREFEVEKGDAQKLVDRLKQSTLTVALGLRENYLLVSIGPSLDVLKDMGKGERLVDGDEFKPLNRFADKRITSLAYVSEDFAAEASDATAQIDQMVNLVTEMIGASELTDAQKERIEADLDEFATDLESLVVEPGAAVSIGFLTDTGYEVFAYNYAEQSMYDGSAGLSLLDHVGGNPLMALVMRGRKVEGQYDLLSKWVTKGLGYIEEYAPADLPPERVEKFKQFMKELRPMLSKLDEANRQLLAPALKDGQGALVLDTPVKSKHPAMIMPQSDEPLPLFVPAFVVGVSDAQKLRQGVGEYVKFINGVAALAHKTVPDDIEEWKLPEPKVKSSAGGDLYCYEAPEEWGLDKNLALCAAVGKNVAVLTLSPAEAEKILATKPATLAGRKLDSQKPKAAVGVCDWAATIEAIRPWANYASDVIIQQKLRDQPEVAKTQGQYVREHIKVICDVLATLKTVETEIRHEDDAEVTHAVYRFQDLK